LDKVIWTQSVSFRHRCISCPKNWSGLWSGVIQRLCKPCNVGGPPLGLAGRQRAFDPSYTHGRMNTPRSVVSSFYVPHGELSFEPVSGADGREARASKRSSRLYGTYKELLQVIEELREESARWLHADQTNAERPVSEDVDCAAKASSGERDDVQPAPVSTALAGNGTSSVSRIELSGSS
jgi:hypothetical protein